MLRNPDFTTAHRVAEVINAYLKKAAAQPVDSSTITMAVPPDFQGNLVSLITDIEQLRIEPDEVARVVIDEQNGIIVMGENVRISTVAVAQGNLTVRITETPQVSQPNPFTAPGIQPPFGARGNNGSSAPGPGAPGAGEAGDARPPGGALGKEGVQFAPGGGAQTVVVPRTDVKIDEQADRRIAVLPAGVTLQELVNSLNALGIGPRDMISILQAIKASGALQAEIELM
jgi:flagellar P-ring protein precursor FlgI